MGMTDIQSAEGLRLTMMEMVMLCHWNEMHCLSWDLTKDSSNGRYLSRDSVC